MLRRPLLTGVLAAVGYDREWFGPDDLLPPDVQCVVSLPRKSATETKFSYCFLFAQFMVLNLVKISGTAHSIACVELNIVKISKPAANRTEKATELNQFVNCMSG